MPTRAWAAAGRSWRDALSVPASSFLDRRGSAPPNDISQTRRGEAPELSVVIWLGFFFMCSQNLPHVIF